MENSSITSKPEPQIICKAVEVTYQLHSYNRSTLKETLINTFKGRNGSVEHRALKGIDLEIQRGEFVAILGHNGSGKSTLLKVLCGILPPTRGFVQTRGVCVPLIELGAGFDPELTGYENIYLSLGLLGLNRKEIAGRIPSIKEFSELGNFLDMPIKTYSSGMHMRLGFACSVCIDADVLLIDEILAVGDENFQKKCFQRMNEIRASGTTMVLVSHDASHAQKMADRVVVLDQGEKVFEGGPSQSVQFYHELMARRLEESKPAHIRNEEKRKKSLLKNEEKLNPDMEAQLRKSTLINEKGRTVIFPEEKGYLSIEFEILIAQATNPCVGFAIHTANAQNLRISGGNTMILAGEGEVLDFRKPGVYTAVFHLKALNLAAGQYRLISAIHNHDLTRTIDINNNALEFEVGNHKDPDNFDKDLISIFSVVKNVEVVNQYLH